MVITDGSVTTPKTGVRAPLTGSEGSNYVAPSYPHVGTAAQNQPIAQPYTPTAAPEQHAGAPGSYQQL